MLKGCSFSFHSGLSKIHPVTLGKYHMNYGVYKSKERFFLLIYKMSQMIEVPFDNRLATGWLQV